MAPVVAEVVDIDEPAPRRARRSRVPSRRPLRTCKAPARPRTRETPDRCSSGPSISNSHRCEKVQPMDHLDCLVKTPEGSLTTACRSAARSWARAPEARCADARFVRSSPGTVGPPLALRGIGPPNCSVNWRFLWRRMSPPLRLCPYFVGIADPMPWGARNAAEFLDSSTHPQDPERLLSSCSNRIDSIPRPRPAFHVLVSEFRCLPGTRVSLHRPPPT